MVETDRRGLSPDGLARAARALKVSADYLLGLTDIPTPAMELSAQAAEAAGFVVAKYALLDAAETIRASMAGEGKGRERDILQSVLTALEAADDALSDPEVLFAAFQGNNGEYPDVSRLASEVDAYRGELSLMPKPLPDEHALDEDGLNSRYVPVLEVATAAGNGRLLEGEHVTGHLAFQRSWLKSHGIDAAQCMVIGVEGDSMEPTLPNGCSILVDHSRRTRRKGRIYVLQTEDGLIVKRTGREKSGWQLISDNPYWPPAPWPDDARIVGEVRWAARTF